jgi:peroxiredoxin
MTDFANFLQGQRAPDFTLPAGPDRRLTLSRLRGQPVVLAFYPADWSPVCSDQMALYQAVMPEFINYGATVVGISVDGVWCHRAFAEDRGISFPLLSDFEPKGEVARMYRSYRSDEGVAERSLFVLDRDGYVAWSHLSPPNVNPGADGILTVLEALAQERQVVR